MMYPTRQRREQRLLIIQETLQSLGVQVAEEGLKLESKKQIDILEFERKILTNIGSLAKMTGEGENYASYQ